jgi:hypothetical protein
MALDIEMFPVRAYPTNGYSWALLIATLVPVGISLYLFITTVWYNTFKNRERLPERFWFITISLVSSVYCFFALNFFAKAEVGNSVSDSLTIILPQVLNSAATLWFFRSMSEFSLRIGSQNSYGRLPFYVINFYAFFLLSLGAIVLVFPFLKFGTSIYKTVLGGFGLQNDVFIFSLLVIPNFIMICDILKTDVLALMRTKMLILGVISVCFIIVIGLNLITFFFFAMPATTFDNGNPIGYALAARRYTASGFFESFAVLYVLLPIFLLADQLFLDSILGLVESEESEDAGNSVYLQVTADF